MNRSSCFKLALALGLLGWAGFRIFHHFQSANATEQTFFYDLSAGKLFAAPRDAIPPIRGTDGDEEDAVRAVVISTNGKPRDRSSWKVAYLQTCAPGLKRQMEEARASGKPLAMGRGLAANLRFVRRISETNWHPLGTVEANRIVNEWLTAGPGGQPATVCHP